MWRPSGAITAGCGRQTALASPGRGTSRKRAKRWRQPQTGKTSSTARRLAAAFINASDTFTALAAELNYTDLALPAEQGGLSAEDFLTQNIDLTPEKLLAFYQVLGKLLAPLTVEQKKVIYAVKGSSMTILPPGV